MPRLIVLYNTPEDTDAFDAHYRDAHTPIDEDVFAEHLYTAGVVDPDLLIRTSGELRVSNFLLWQIAYAEIHVTKVLWPDFRRRHLYEAIIDFQARERRFGGVDQSDAEIFLEADQQQHA